MKRFLPFFVVPFLFACKKNNDDAVNPKPDVVFWGLTSNNQLIRYNTSATQSPIETVAVSGLTSGEKLMSIDFRPSTGQLYALGNSSRLYTINLGANKGVATALGTAAFSPAVSGTIASIDFNPTVDRIRLVTNTGQNLRLHPETGAVAATDIAINGVTGASVTGVAYTNSISGAVTTSLFDIDVTNKKLYKQSPPNDGKLVEVGSITASFTGQAGFDINADNSSILAAFTTSDGTTKMYTLDTANANTAFIGTTSTSLIDIAIPTNAVAYAVSDAQALQIFNPLTNTQITSKTIAGLGVGEFIAGIDFRPANGQLYGISLTSTGDVARIYTFNLGTGAVTAVGSTLSITTGTTAVGFDFNPTVDKIRLVTNLGQNMRLNPADATIAGSDVALNPGTPAVTGAAYTNSFAGATTTTLFVLNSTRLFKQDPPNNGLLTDIGPLGITAESQSGFDIGGTSNQGYALLTSGGTTKLYTVNTTTGAAVSVREYPNKITGLAIGGGF
ncbi:protein of unknown function [Filimonas lacunae]|uniref:DUF4394 domain-containing protein n=1 Tax=Filimonas lacunae TaxID=477680 RepID=A0A173MHM7_9BACT|nr:DUF4394 domain-containing protein [Filimonas lacunae]BAV06990.1 hypothetical protein FLA_3010 [Filimonas lacunae]SIS96774.1 protein of unknown function [Filimonas lacunae]